MLCFSGNEYTNIFGSNSFDGSLTPYIHNIFKPECKTCILDGEMLLYHPESKTFGKLCTCEPSHEKINNVVSEQVRHKSGCTITEAG